MACWRYSDHPVAHEDDVRRAVQAGLEITRDVRPDSVNRPTAASALRSTSVWVVQPRTGVSGHHSGRRVRVGRQSGGTGVESGASECGGGLPTRFEPADPSRVRSGSPTRSAGEGVEGLINHFRVVDERAEASRSRGPLVGRDRDLARLQRVGREPNPGTLTPPGSCFAAKRGIGKSRLAAAAIEMVERDGGGCGGVGGLAASTRRRPCIPSALFWSATVISAAYTRLRAAPAAPPH